MNYNFSRKERLILADPADARLRHKVSTSRRVLTILSSPEFLALLAICVLGLLLTLALALATPSFGELSESLQEFL